MTDVCMKINANGALISCVAFKEVLKLVRKYYVRFSVFSETKQVMEIL